MNSKKNSAPITMFWERISNRTKWHSVEFGISVTAFILSILALLMRVFAI